MFGHIKTTSCSFVSSGMIFDNNIQRHMYLYFMNPLHTILDPPCEIVHCVTHATKSVSALNPTSRTYVDIYVRMSTFASTGFIVQATIDACIVVSTALNFVTAATLTLDEAFVSLDNFVRYETKY